MAQSAKSRSALRSEFKLALPPFAIRHPPSHAVAGILAVQLAQQRGPQELASGAAPGPGQFLPLLRGVIDDLLRNRVGLGAAGERGKLELAGALDAVHARESFSHGGAHR